MQQAGFNSWRTYAVLSAVFVLSIVVAMFVPGPAIQELAGIPVVMALAGTVVQIMRDQAAHERALLAINHQNQFALGASSHMANVAFDKHVEFCEEYIVQAQEALHTVFRCGPSVDILPHTGKLLVVRQKYALWISSKIEDDLQPFERALSEMGASAGYADSTRGNPSAKDRKEHINRMYRLLAKVTNSKEWEGEVLTDDLAVSTQVQYLRAILGIEQLNEMRRTIIFRAANELKRNS